MKYLAYHSIGRDNGEIGAELYCVKEDDFRKQMEYLTGADNARITFDDGDATNFMTAYPILKELGLKAYFFVIGGRIGDKGYMDLDQIKELARSGMTIGSHGMTHKILTGLSEKDLDFEIKYSKDMLEDNLEFTVDSISIPRGFYTEKIIEKIKEAGYKKVFTSNFRDDDGFRFGRISVKRDWSEMYFIRVMEKGFSVKDNIKELIKESVKKTLGPEKYNKIRAGILKKYTMQVRL